LAGTDCPRRGRQMTSRSGRLRRSRRSHDRGIGQPYPPPEWARADHHVRCDTRGQAEQPRLAPERRLRARSLRPAPPLNVRSYVDLALPTIAPCNTPSGPASGSAGAGRRAVPLSAKPRSGICIRIAGSAPIGGKILPVPSPAAGPQGAQRAGRVPRRWQRCTAHSGPGGGGSCRTWEPSTSSGSSNARPPNRPRLAGLPMITPRWTLSAAIPLS
jgi:hypothetical protein